MNNCIANDYIHNNAFREYVDKFAKQNQITVEESITHELVRQVWLYYTEV